MCKNWDHKRDEIVTTIKCKIKKINELYRKGPSLYFYRKLIAKRKQFKSIESFVKCNYHIELLYAALASWDMNSRRAKMKYFDEFRNNIESCLDLFKEIEKFERNNTFNITELEPILEESYEKLSLMETEAKLVSNSKLLHFLFPNLLMPMDRKNTLFYFYGNPSESPKKYFEITEFSLEIIKMHRNLEQYLDDGWNTTVPKLIDNAIILIRREEYK